MEETYIRVGGTEYKRLNGSYGITTLTDRHVSIRREKLHFRFRGKSGVFHTISLRSRKLARIVKQCRDIPGQELFQYYDKQGVAHVIDSGRLNGYLREAMGSEFTAKDLRTWSGTLEAFCVMKMHAVKAQRQITEVIGEVARKLGNTVAVCRKYYIHPYLIQLFENDTLDIFKVAPSRSRKPGYLSQDEKVLLKILKKA